MTVYLWIDFYQNLKVPEVEVEEEDLVEDEEEHAVGEDLEEVEEVVAEDAAEEEEDLEEEVAAEEDLEEEVAAAEAVEELHSKILNDK